MEKLKNFTKEREKVRVRAREHVWEMLDSEDEFADARKCMRRQRKKLEPRSSMEGTGLSYRGMCPIILISAKKIGPLVIMGIDKGEEKL